MPAPLAARGVGAALAPYTLLALDDADGIARHIAHAGGPLAACEAACVVLDQADRATGFDADAALSSARVGAVRLIAAALETDAAHGRAALVAALVAVRECCQEQRRRRDDHARIRATAERLTGRTLASSSALDAVITASPREALCLRERGPLVEGRLTPPGANDHIAGAAPPPPHDELTHHHVCPGCGTGRACRMMHCRDVHYARPCWSCVTAGRA